MILPDVNILVHAFRADSEDHDLCRSWLEEAVNGEPRFGLSPLILSSVIRIATHPKIFRQPSTRSESFGFCDALRSRPNCVLVRPGTRHWSIFAGLCDAVDARGHLVPDAWLAALAIESGCEWISLDRGFARFPGLRWRPPG